MRQAKWLTSLVLILMTIFIVSGCGELPEKPTEINDSKSEQTVEDTKKDKDKKNSNNDAVTKLNEDSLEEKSEEKSENHEPENTSKETESQTNKNKKENKSNEDSKQNKNNSPEKESVKNNKKDKKEKSSSNQTSESKSKDEKSQIKKSKDQVEQKGSSSDQKSIEKDNEKSKNEENKNNTKKGSQSDSSEEEKTKESKPTINISIVISSEEVPLPPTKLKIEEGDTALDALVDVTKKNKIQMDYRGGQGASAYVEGIDNVYEFDRGPGSGWMFSVNNIFPNRGVGIIPLEDGDKVEFLYTENLGEDLGADLQPFR